MKHLHIFVAFFCILFFSVNIIFAETLLSAPKVGDVYKMSLVTKKSHESSDSSGSSTTRNALVKRIIDVRAEGVELVYDLPESTTEKARERQWQFPARVFQPLDGALQLLNGAELEERVNSWLIKFKIPRSACGSTVFTWTAFDIECDPQSVLKAIGVFDIGVSRLYDGAIFQDPAARGVGILARKTAEQEEEAFTALMPINPDVVRRDRAEADVKIGRMTNKPVAFEAAMARREKETVSGTVSFVFETDPAGKVQRRTKIIKTEITTPDGAVESSTKTETLEQVLLPAQEMAGEESRE